MDIRSRTRHEFVAVISKISRRNREEDRDQYVQRAVLPRHVFDYEIKPGQTRPRCDVLLKIPREKGPSQDSRGGPVSSATTRSRRRASAGDPVPRRGGRLSFINDSGVYSRRRSRTLNLMLVSGRRYWGHPRYANVNRFGSRSSRLVGAEQGGTCTSRVPTTIEGPVFTIGVVNFQGRL